MPEALEIINRVISEHRAIREHVKLAGDTVNDVEALFSLQRAQAGWSQASITAITEKRDQLIQTIHFLERGLRSHFGFEERELPPLFGEMLMKALLHEHREIGKQVETAKTALDNMQLEGLDQKELLSKKATMQKDISDLGQAVEEHAYREEVILNMMKRALEENKAK